MNFRSPAAGWFELDADGSWEPWRPFAPVNVDWRDPNLRLVDVDGDGLPDVLITEDEVLTWYQWNVGEGFGEARRVPKPADDERGPALVFSDGAGAIFLADMSGDGLSDLVRIRSGDTSYWPNLGYGRYGPKVVMDGAPVFENQDLFDERRLRLADIDGSGTTDLVYLGSDSTTIWFNHSGNAWTAGRRVSRLPPVDDIAQTSVFDLLGTGTSAIVWTSPLPDDATEPLRYIDLTGSVKPYLLTRVSNNLGATTSVTYAPSTRFYLEDRAAGNPWITRLPFPVHVVARVETDEAVSRTSLVSTYKYHHGFYDPTEREFRGFAHVDELDAESLPSDSGTGQFTGTPEIDGDDFALAPVWTRTWYHTGAYVDRVDIARRLAREFYGGDAQAPHLADTAVPTDLDAEGQREACRALHGRMLRQEIYAQDDSPAAVSPYLTTEDRYKVDQLQPPTGDSYGSYYPWELESVACHYERDPTDPRVGHELNLAIDSYGNVTASASVGYPRRNPAIAPQSTTLVTYTEADYANAPDQTTFYRLGLAVESRGYELTGVAAGGPFGLFDHDALGAAAAGAAAIPYEAVPTGTTPQRRLLAHARTYYRSDDLQTALPLGQVESLGLVDRTYQLAYTPGLLDELFVSGGKITASSLASQLAGPGGFVDLDGDGNQWAPLPRTLYSSDPANPDAGFARMHFYLPQGAVDPWGGVATVVYDGYDLLVKQTTDAVGNITLAQHNYRMLTPWLATDPNQNRSGVRFDALGMVIATAQIGKLMAGNQDEGDHLDLSTAEASPSDDPTTRLEYDLNAFATWAADPAQDPDHPAPAWVHTLARVIHKDPQTQWLETYTYTDGLGRIALTKAQAEPGDAPERAANGNLVRDANGDLVLAATQTRWVGTGRVVYDNKGNPVKAYEPFFDSSPVCVDETDLVEWGVTSITRYDPLSRVVRVDNPNGTYTGLEHDPWGTAGSDENDTVLDGAWYAARAEGQLGDDELDAATKASADAATPTVSNQDPLGRVCETVMDNGAAGKYSTSLTLDVEGHVLATTDALGREVQSSDYSPGGRELHRTSIDAGQRWILYDAAGQHLLAWDSRQHQIRCTYDALHRPVGLYVTTGTGPDRLAEQVIYGEGLATAQAQNLRGAEYQRKDEAGIATTLQRDFKGNILASARELLSDYVEDVDWSSSPTLADDPPFTTNETFDALNRVTTATAPDSSITTPVFNDRGLLASVSVTLASTGVVTTVVASSAYDAKGQRQSVAYGNGTVTTYNYDRETFRLTELKTTRPGDVGALQDLSYTYDPVGNVTRLRDDAQQTIFFDNQVVSPSADYTYDAIYRLVMATGREQIGQAGQPQTGWSDAARVMVPLPTDGQAMRTYTEKYTYDEVGNFAKLAHTANLGTWIRTYAYDERADPPTNNRLTSTTVNGDTETYAYDDHGNIVSMAHLSLIQWDWKDQLQATASQIVNDGIPGTTFYTYDSAGERIVKATNKQDGRRAAERIYLGGYEVYRTYDSNGNVKLERQSLHVSSGAGRICLFETTTVDATAPPTSLPTTLTRYQLTNHLGSAVLELDHAAAIITYEEYYPYGSTSLQSGRSAAEVSLKRYRYTGQERDNESGFYYHGARYYASWLGRWISPDPAGLRDGPSLYPYVRGNPVIFSDPSGMWGWRETAVLAAAVIVGTVVTVATAGVAAPLVAGALASAGLTGVSAAIVTGAAVGAVAGAAGGAASELTRQVGIGEAIGGARIGHAALVGAEIGAATGGVGAYASTVSGAAQLNRATSAVRASSIGRAGAAVARTVSASARAVARVPGAGAVVSLGKEVVRNAARGLQSIERTSENLGVSLGRGVFARASGGLHAVERFNQARSVAGTFDASAPRVYRVQGGIPPAASRVRMIVGSKGEMLVRGRAMLHATLEDAGHARYFQARRPGAEILSFEIDRRAAEQIRAQAVPQRWGRAFPGDPQVDDPSVTSSAFGLPRSWVNRLQAAAQAGTGQVGGLGILNNQSTLLTGSATPTLRHDQ